LPSASPARPIRGAAGAVWSVGRKPRVVSGFTIADGKIVEIDIIAGPEHIDRLDLEFRTRGA
jgi:RNA polymerase sigma-70 factor (ECF subfamily)